MSRLPTPALRGSGATRMLSSTATAAVLTGPGALIFPARWPMTWSPSRASRSRQAGSLIKAEQ
jgi:hypothetical protein